MNGSMTPGPMIPALVLGSAQATTLEVMRALGRRGIPQYVVGAGRSFVSRSRWHRLPPGRYEDPVPSSLPEFLSRVACERMVLIPCTDDWVLAMARLDPALGARFPASLAPRESIELLLDKGRFAEAAQRLGLPHPWTISLASEDDLVTLPDSAFRQAFLKPCYSPAFVRRYGVKAFRFNDRSQAVAAVREARRAGFRLVLQEYIQGPPSRYYFVNGFIDRAGIVRAWSVSQRLRTFPPDFADGCYGISIPLEAVASVMDDLRRFLGALRYRGVFDAEVKYDERDGLYKVLEINARPYGNIGFAARCGVDFVTMAYQDALSLPVEPAIKYEAGRRWFNPSADWQLVQHGTLAPWRWARSWLGAYQPIFSWDDPLPAVVPLLGRVRKLTRRAVLLSSNGA